MSVNLHLAFGGMKHASRVRNETKSVAASGLFRKIYVGCLGTVGEPPIESWAPDLEVVELMAIERDKKPGFLGKLLRTIKFGWKSVGLARKVGVDVVNVHSLALLPIGCVIKLVCRAKLIYDAHELEVETVNKTGVKKLVGKLVERSLIRFCDLIIVVGDRIREWYSASYGLNNIVTVRNCPSLGARVHSDKFREEFGISPDSRIVLYQGNLFEGRGVRRLLGAFSKIKGEEFVLVFMGSGPLVPLVREQAQVCKNIFYREPVLVSELPFYTASADIGMSIIVDSCLNHRYCLPNKFFQYIHAGLPQICAGSLEKKDIVEKFGIGHWLEDFTPQGLLGQIQDIASWDEKELERRLQDCASQFCWETQEKAMLDGYKSILN